MNKISIRELFKANLPFLLPFLFFLIAGGIWISLYSRAEIHIYINDHTHGLGDTFFRFITSMGDGLAVALIALLFLLFNIGQGLQLAFSGIFAGVLTQMLKHTLFSDWERPKKFFEGVHQLYLVPGVNNYSGHTFPSGHTASAFALYFSIAIFVRNKTLKFLLFILASLVAFSRIYLSQHFFNDVYAGSILGILAAFSSWLLLTRFKMFSGANWMQKSLLLRKTGSI